MTDEVLLVGSAYECLPTLNLRCANLHGLIAGATGTGKTVTFAVLGGRFLEGWGAGFRR